MPSEFVADNYSHNKVSLVPWRRLLLISSLAVGGHAGSSAGLLPPSKAVLCDSRLKGFIVSGEERKHAGVF